MALLTSYNLHCDCCLQARSAYLRDIRTLKHSLTHTRHHLVLIPVEMLIRYRSHSTAGRMKSMKIFNVAIGNQTRDPSCL